MKPVVLTLFLCIILSLFPIKGVQNVAQAQNLTIAELYEIEGDNLQTGQIVSFTSGTYHLSKESYDKSVVGVINTEPPIEIRSTGAAEGQVPIISNGLTDVLVNTKNGPIKSGDIITTSDTPGIGMKSNKSGFIVGIAQGEYSASDPNQAGLIPVSLTIKFAFVEDSPESEKIGSRLLDLVKLSTIAAYESPLDTLRYVLASVIVIAALAVTFFTTGKGVRNGIEAIGRNPLASKTIMSGIIFNVILSLIITVSSLAAAYVVTTL